MFRVMPQTLFCFCLLLETQDGASWANFGNYISRNSGASGGACSLLRVCAWRGKGKGKRQRAKAQVAALKVFDTKTQLPVCPPNDVQGYFKELVLHVQTQ